MQGDWCGSWGPFLVFAHTEFVRGENKPIAAPVRASAADVCVPLNAAPRCPWGVRAWLVGVRSPGCVRALGTEEGALGPHPTPRTPRGSRRRHWPAAGATRRQQPPGYLRGPGKGSSGDFGSRWAHTLQGCDSLQGPPRTV